MEPFYIYLTWYLWQKNNWGPPYPAPCRLFFRFFIKSFNVSCRSESSFQKMEVVFHLPKRVAGWPAGRWKTTSNMFLNGRRPQIFIYREDDLNYFWFVWPYSSETSFRYLIYILLWERAIILFFIIYNIYIVVIYLEFAPF